MIDVIVDVMVDGIDEVIGVMIGEVVIGVVIGEINAFQCSSGFLFHPLKAHECLCLEVVVVPGELIHVMCFHQPPLCVDCSCP